MAKQSLVSDEVIAQLKDDAIQFANQKATSIIREKNVIGASITRHNDGTISVTMGADIKVARMARAQEWGSGIHTPAGKPKKNLQADGTYIIKPRTKTLLAFHWDKIPNPRQETHNWFKAGPYKFRGLASDDRLMFTHVNHPGVPAVNNGAGYMRPGAEMAVEKNVPKVADDMKNNAIRAIRASFAKKWQKK